MTQENKYVSFNKYFVYMQKNGGDSNEQVIENRTNNVL